jgi:hypothetical protein
LPPPSQNKTGLEDFLHTPCGPDLPTQPVHLGSLGRDVPRLDPQAWLLRSNYLGDVFFTRIAGMGSTVSAPPSRPITEELVHREGSVPGGLGTDSSISSGFGGCGVVRKLPTSFLMRSDDGRAEEKLGEPEKVQTEKQDGDNAQSPGVPEGGDVDRSRREEGSGGIGNAERAETDGDSKRGEESCPAQTPRAKRLRRSTSDLSGGSNRGIAKSARVPVENREDARSIGGIGPRNLIRSFGAPQEALVDSVPTGSLPRGVTPSTGHLGSNLAHRNDAQTPRGGPRDPLASPESSEDDVITRELRGQFPSIPRA